MSSTNEEDASKEQGAVERRLDRIDLFMAAIVLVTIIGFVTLLVTVAGLVITYQSNGQTANQALRDEVKTQNGKIDALTKELREQETN